MVREPLQDGTFYLFGLSGAPGESRTPDLVIRSFTQM